MLENVKEINLLKLKLLKTYDTDYNEAFILTGRAWVYTKVGNKLKKTFVDGTRFFMNLYHFTEKISFQELFIKGSYLNLEDALNIIEKNAKRLGIKMTYKENQDQYTDIVKESLTYALTIEEYEVLCATPSVKIKEGYQAIASETGDLKEIWLKKEMNPVNINNILDIDIPDVDLEKFGETILENRKSSRFASSGHVVVKMDNEEHGYISGAYITSNYAKVLCTSRFSRALFFLEKKDARKLLSALRKISKEPEYQIMEVEQDRLYEVSSPRVRIKI